ncbi:NAC domain-containing protein 83-like isoform X4 [Phalaenopsis equestris]|uniref:NAC domain-containing protein 83-like isoform X4 n=1 Tax=Phalaenopsis equestris TaxID=78828 RepID=UPI0009E2E549|nr:NAC domain-containing protein 83-like isoform X4 [Phalaenopsis equestris]
MEVAMCPPAPFPLRPDINVSATDEEVLLFLGGRKAGDPVPSNIITEVNPFSVEPWNSPEDIWYLSNFEDGCSSGQQNTFKVMKIGCWRLIDHLTIYRGSVAAGSKTTWQFYMGQAPPGNRTGWLMYHYQRVQKACQGIIAAQDPNSIFRVFLQEESPHTAHRCLASSDKADGEHVESMLLRFLEEEEGSSPTNAADQSELGAPQQRHDKSNQDFVTNNSAADLDALVEFSKGEYLELEDIFDLESTSSSSDDSSLISSNSDDGFDAEALLKDLENDNSSHNINNTHSMDNELVLSNSLTSDGCSSKAFKSPPKSEQLFSTGTSAGFYPRSQPKRTHSGSSASSSSSSNGSGSKSVARIRKLGKKYCCFTPF